MDLTDQYIESGSTFFGRYGAATGVTVSQRDGYGEIDYHIRFYHGDCFKQFLDEISQLQEFINERNLRESNPVIQRAYDEYKLLLKLSK